jgi:hypothetical protein
MLKFDFAKNYKMVIGTVVVVILGIGTGYLLSGKAGLGGGPAIAA